MPPQAAEGAQFSAYENCHIPLIRLAIRSTPSPVWEKAFIVMHYARNLAALLNYCYPSRLIPAPNHVPWHADRRSAQGWRSQTEGEIFKGTDGACADPDTRIFPATGAAGGQGHSQLKTSNFYIAHRFFVTFFTEESNVPLFPSPLRQKQRRGASSAGAANNV